MDDHTCKDEHMRQDKLHILIDKLHNHFDMLGMKVGDLEQKLKEVEEVAASTKLKVLRLVMEQNNNLETIFRLKQENHNLKIRKNQSDSVSTCSSPLSEESAVVKSSSQCQMEPKAALENETICFGQSLVEVGKTLTGSAQTEVQNSGFKLQRVEKRKKEAIVCPQQLGNAAGSFEHQNQSIPVTDLQQLQREHFISSMKFIGRMGEGVHGTVSVVEVEGIPCIAKKPRDTLIIREMFERECSVLARLHHPNIIQYMGVYCTADPRDLTLIMEYLPIDLEKVLYVCRNHFPLSLHLSVLLDVSLGMLYLHYNGLVHCDLAPDNILLSPSLDAKIADLGCTKILGSRDVNGYPQTTVPAFWAYMPPQVFRRNFLYTEKLDVFSYGVLALYITTQTFPERYMGCDVSQGAREKNEEEIERHWSGFARLDQEHCLLSLIRKCLKDEECDRPTSGDVSRCLRFWARKYPKKLEEVVLVNSQLQNKLMTTAASIAASLADDDFK